MAFEALKERQSVMWGNGPYERITATLVDMHDTVLERLDPKEGARLLDVACGTGAFTLRAAERGADVTGVDIAPVLIERAQELAAESGIDVRFEVGDAENLPYEDASFDLVSSTVGVMFAPDHDAVARELVRVTRPGGRLALACWTPEGGLGQMFGMMRPFLPTPPEGVRSPFELGRRERIEELFGDAFELEFEEHDSVFRTESGESYWELFSSSYGPTKTAADALEPERREEFRRAWVDFFERQREGDEVVHHREWLLTLGTRR